MTEQIKCVNILLDSQTQIDHNPYFKTLDKIFDNIEDIVISVDFNNKIININLAAEKMIQTSKDSILGLNINNLIERLGLINYKIIQEEDFKIYIIKKSSEKVCDGYNNNQEKINDVKDKECFLYNISHEIRTPLNGIIGMTQILKNKVDDNLKEYIDIISTCGYQLMDILNDILDYAKITSGGICINPIHFNLRKCIEEIHDIIIPKITNSNIDISYEIDPNIPENIFCDKKRLKQILLNLLSNSAKFTENGFIKTSVMLGHKDSDKLTLIFKVSDSGIGIPSSHFEKIFKPYIQVNNHLIHKYEGTGLGLSISLQLAKLLNGDIKVASELGVGSEFSLNIDVLENDRNKNKDRLDSSSISSPSSSSPSSSSPSSESTKKNSFDSNSSNGISYFQENNYVFDDDCINQENTNCDQIIKTLKNICIDKKILIIDDNCNNRLILCNLLAEISISPIMASCLEEGFLIKKAFKFDLIFLNTSLIELHLKSHNPSDSSKEPFFCCKKNENIIHKSSEIYEICEELDILNIPIIGITTIDNSLNFKNDYKFNDMLIKPIKKYNLCKVLAKIFQ
jgi:signal transduction histidine kinase